MRRIRAPRTLPNVLGSIAAVLFSLTALVGFAHTKAGHPLLAWMAARMGHGAARCPLGYDRAASPANREAWKARFASWHRGDEAAASRPALGFALDLTTRDEVTAWANAHALTCAPSRGRGPADLSCPDVPDTALPEAFRGVGTQTLWFTFGNGEHLLSVVAVAHTATADSVAAAYTSVTQTLDRDVGLPRARAGEATPAQLASGALYQASSEYRFRDYYAVARATNVGNGFALTEEYRSLAD
jgi:hypothetical protein